MHAIEKNNASRKRGIKIAAFSALALAITNVASPLIYHAGTNPQTVLMLRGIVTFIVIAIILVYGRRLKLLPFKDELNCVISGIIFSFAGYGLLNALQIAPVSIVVLILYLFPLLTTVFDAIIIRTMPSGRAFLLLLMALTGLALALNASEHQINQKGMWLAFLAAVSASSTLVWNNHKLTNVDPEQITFRMFVVSFIVFGTMLWISGEYSIPATANGRIGLLALLICFAFAFLAMFRGSQMAGSVNAAMIMNLEPIGTIFLSVLLLGEVVGLKTAIGAAMVILAVLLSQVFGKKTFVSGDLK